MGCYAEGSLAQSLAEFEMNLERDVLLPLNKLSEDELPAILKHRKQLQKLLTDWNSAKTRLSQLHKNILASQGGSSAGTPAKLESLKEEEEELHRRVEQSKDDYLSDLYHFGTKENEYKNYFTRLLELQAEYHRKSLAQLTDVLGELRDTIKESAPAQQPPAEVYGVPLATHLERFGCEIAVPISACVRMLLTHGMQEEGLFRLAAGASILKKLKTSLGAGAKDLAEFISEPHAVAGALKSYLRELPEPLMTSELFDDWMKAASIKEPEKRQESYREVCAKLPPENYNNLRYLIKFLAKLAEHQEVNKMTPSNIAIVLGPNLLWARCEGDSYMLDMASASPILVVSVVEGLISCSSEVFPGVIDFGVPEESVTPPPAASTPHISTTLLKSYSTDLPTSPTLPPPSTTTEIDDDSLCDTQEPSSSKATAVKMLPPTDDGNVMGTQGECSPSTVRKVKRPAPLRPNVPPPIQPRGATTNEPSDELQNPRPIPRRNFGGSVKVPNLPPPHPPAPKAVNAKPEANDADLSRKTPPRPLPRNRIQSTDN
ncbi:SH3 domain-binding protein 1 isoform X2 [Pyxicephalus adspersus]